MPEFRSTSQTIVLGIILLASLVGATALFYTGSEPGLRAGLGLLLLIAIVATSTRLGVAELITRTLTPRSQRRFHRLRSHVARLLDEIKLLNGIAEDQNRGFRGREKAEQELDAIEGRIRHLIEGVRQVAGQADQAQPSDEEEAHPD
jgi:hypothetical protein